ncbi:hypothetical protein BDR07DRAFT_1072946 [Suillus spraguei]|nr:hypothetical protein BDR07DRAFT_1072946 [Suillus spraguei]
MHDTLIRQLNVFTGRSYFPCRHAYVKPCPFLEIYATDLKDQGTFETESNGFLRPEHRSPAANLPTTSINCLSWDLLMALSVPAVAREWGTCPRMLGGFWLLDS